MTPYFFYTLVDLAALNAYVIHTEYTKKVDRFVFLQNLALQLVEEYANCWAPGLHLSVLACNSKVTGKPIIPSQRDKYYLCDNLGHRFSCKCNIHCCNLHCRKTLVCNMCHKNDKKAVPPNEAFDYFLFLK